MADSDFGAKYGSGESREFVDAIDKPRAIFFKQYFGWFGLPWDKVILAIIIVLAVLVIAFFFGWIGTAAVKNEGLWGSSGPGNTNPLYKVHGIERLDNKNNQIVIGYEADPDAFCKGAGTATTDPWEYVRSSVEGADDWDVTYPGPTKESFSGALGYGASSADLMDADLIASMRGHK